MSWQRPAGEPSPPCWETEGNGLEKPVGVTLSSDPCVLPQHTTAAFVWRELGKLREGEGSGIKEQV